MSNPYEDEARRRPKSRNFRPLLNLTPFLRPCRRQMVFALMALLTAAGATLAVPVAVRRIIDHGFTAENATLIDKYFLAMLAVVVVLAISSAMRFYFVMWIGERVVADIRDAVFGHLLNLSPAFFETQRSGEVLSRLTADTTQIKSAFSSTASIALRNVVMLIGAVFMMVASSPKLAGLSLLALPLIVLPLVTYGRRVRSLSRLAQDTLASSAAFAQERLLAVSTVQANVQETAARRQFGAATASAFDAAAQRTFARAVLTALIIGVATGAVVILLWTGASNVILGSMSPGTLSQFLIYAILAASSMGQLSEVWGEVQLAAGAAERISELLDEKPVITAPAAPQPLPKPPQGRLALDRVTFAYPSRPGQDALTDVSFSVKPGETVAIVGPSGAGKTTVFALAQRFFDPQKGVVTVDGIDVKTAVPQEVRQRIAVVPQETVIFSGSIMDNIRFGKPEARAEDVLEAARAARVDEFAERLPRAYDTQVGERGVTLSGGQRQRIAIARAILRDAPILLLDEATSALDAESEAFIQQAIEKLTANRTTLVIAHRLATVRNADRILVLDGGQLVAEGAHEELINTSPLYARLAKLQFTAQAAE
ncbi:ABC transporter transmembrane domain-containing protein [Aestuariivirga sp.]|uniref:ABC transporter transmembrane domain-containing protein n=1 Tax=Aestuariivirga sp. TaxID=2650926 RepID=UPI0025C48BB2|nr:ABC transporter transmembrane domain-containing protein [Aestuariivirga sp.]MCA3556390.1 ATP-binding cassette domain-containing protein [Aestuariivirga sp.]